MVKYTNIQINVSVKKDSDILARFLIDLKVYDCFQDANVYNILFIDKNGECAYLIVSSVKCAGIYGKTAF